MKDSLFEDYSKKHVQYYDEGHPILVEFGLALVKEIFDKPSILDLGCGDGRLLFSLYKKGLLNNFDEIVGVDISERRIDRTTMELPFVNGVVSDALNVKGFPSSYFDYIICSQLIEHVEDDDSLLVEIKRLLKRGRLAYISSVIKSWYGVYFYFSNGSFRLDPTHVREYKSADEFVSLIASKGFEAVDVNTRQVMLPLLDLTIRLFVKFGFMRPDVSFFQKKKFLNKIRKIKVPIVGYKSVEVLARKIE
jgi:ubiquinone/menaquinone biosynthesis C-methylase UbiE